MEILLLALLLSQMKENSDLSETIQKALTLYRENRELVSTLLTLSQSGKIPPSQEKEHEKQPPQAETAEQFNVLEEYLKRHAI